MRLDTLCESATCAAALLCRLSCRPTTKAEKRNAGTRILYLFEQETQREADELMIQSSNNALPTLYRQTDILETD
ncbi:hypothetical protein BDA96_01G232100 [Sorghum bicolor]|jgi:hypothetical protein|uniref:Uncharacterized protein n=1 Tax=Sorghum bicolor TaxID=4558 RepID=A0A921S0B7_SORBI|nr:hypothetical protein BDA96_01G232100 [Sorghum bicolor]